MTKATAVDGGDVKAQRVAEVRKRLGVVDTAATKLAAAIDTFSVDEQDLVLRRAVSDIANELMLDDPYDDVDQVERLNGVLRDIRSDIKCGDIEHALLLIRYEMGDW